MFFAVFVHFEVDLFFEGGGGVEGEDGLGG